MRRDKNATCHYFRRGVLETLPRTTREAGEWIERSFGIVYESRSGLVSLLHRLGFEHRKPNPVSQKPKTEKQKVLIKQYNNLINSLEDDEAVVFADAAHPTHGARPVGCWAPKDVKIAVDQANGRERLNIHGTIDLESGKTHMLEVTTVDALSTIALLVAIEAMFPAMRLIHAFFSERASPLHVLKGSQESNGVSKTLSIGVWT